MQNIFQMKTKSFIANSTLRSHLLTKVMQKLEQLVYP